MRSSDRCYFIVEFFLLSNHSPVSSAIVVGCSTRMQILGQKKLEDLSNMHSIHTFSVRDADSESYSCSEKRTVGVGRDLFGCCLKYQVSSNSFLYYNLQF